MHDLDSLLHGWRTLALAARSPDRVTPWDLVVITASGGSQAAIYRAQLDRLARLGRWPGQTRTLVVPDRDGVRIGSGGSTLEVLRCLVAEGFPPAELATKRILVVHAGGDSKRLAWAAVMGKAFVPLPLLATPDDSVPTLFEHLLALVAGVPARFVGGGMLLLTGDVLPLVDAAALAWGSTGEVEVVLTPASLVAAGRHGVAVVEAAGRVSRLFQKASIPVLTAGGAVLEGGGALIDTGIWRYGPVAVAALADWAASPADPVGALARDRREFGLYDDLPGACLPVQGREDALATALRIRLAGCRLGGLVAPDLRFLHLGTSAEYLTLIGRPWGGLRQATVQAEGRLQDLGGGIVLHSRIGAGGALGEGAVIIDSDLGPGCRIGHRSLVLGIHSPDLPVELPAHLALWRVALPERAAATVWVGIDDDPKTPLEGATWGNRALGDWLARHGVMADDCWVPGESRTLWTARLFPISAEDAPPPWAILAWALAEHPAGDDPTAETWRCTPRLALGDLARRCDSAACTAVVERHRGRQALRALEGVVDHGTPRDAGALAAQLTPDQRGALLEFLPRLDPARLGGAARTAWLGADLAAAAGIQGGPGRESAWVAVQREVARALPPVVTALWEGVSAGRVQRAALPARFDLAGGWSDTPPYCLEHPAQVLNLAVELAGKPSFGAEAETLAEPVWDLASELGQIQVDSIGEELLRPGSPVGILAAAAIACGAAVRAGDRWRVHRGLRLRTFSTLPAGSGMGGSSIVAAVAVRALLGLAGQPTDPASVASRVLAAEQLLGSGGGWQDQFGALVPGAKMLKSAPVLPLRIEIEPIPLAPAVVAALERRLILVDSGITRVARGVLGRIMGRYLARDAAVTQGIRRLVDLAADGRDALARGDLDRLGPVIAEVWRIHQRMDPACSTPALDRLATAAGPGLAAWKCGGAGGGGMVGLFLTARADPTVVQRRIAEAGYRTVPWRLALGS